MKNLLEIDSVILEFGMRRILQDVYFKCETGKVTGLLGRNGTGKSCLMKIMFGELIPSHKSIRIDGKALPNSHRSPDNLRYLPQSNFIPNWLTLERIFDDFDLEFEAFLQDFPEFEKYQTSKISGLSGGTRRIIEIYIILISKTKFCMLDEPFSQIMPIHLEVIKGLILREKENKGIIVSDHLYEHIIDVCDDIYLIKDGTMHLIKELRDIETLGYARIL